MARSNDVVGKNIDSQNKGMGKQFGGNPDSTETEKLPVGMKAGKRKVLGKGKLSSTGMKTSADGDSGLTEKGSMGKKFPRKASYKR